MEDLGHEQAPFEAICKRNGAQLTEVGSNAVKLVPWVKLLAVCFRAIGSEHLGLSGTVA